MTTTLSLFACKNVSFEEPFHGGQEIKIFISKSHATDVLLELVEMAQQFGWNL